MQDFSQATCFNDLVECNILFLKGILDETPSHCASLNTESSLIISELIELCDTHHILTIESQPAEQDDDYRQRGYLTGAVIGNVDNFVKKLNNMTDLEYVVKCDNKFYSNISIRGICGQHASSTHTHGDQCTMSSAWCFTDELIDGRWISHTRYFVNDLFDICDSEYEFYATDDYDLIYDDEVIRFTVCDPDFGLETNHCCTELIKVFA